MYGDAGHRAREPTTVEGTSTRIEHVPDEVLAELDAEGRASPFHGIVGPYTQQIPQRDSHGLTLLEPHDLRLQRLAPPTDRHDVTEPHARQREP